MKKDSMTKGKSSLSKQPSPKTEEEIETGSPEDKSPDDMEINE